MRSMRLWQVVILSASLALLLVNGNGASTTQAAAGIAHGWTQVARPGFGNPANESISALEVYNGQLYAGTINWSSGASVWRSSNGVKWDLVAAPGQISSANNPAITDMIVFQNRLYVATAWSSLPSASYQIWRYDGAKWENVIGSTAYPVNGFAGFEVFNNVLYVGTFKTWDANQGADIMRSTTGNPGSWTNVMTNGNGNAKSYSITSLKVFNGFIYAALGNDVKGVQVVRSSDGLAWTTVVGDGFGGSCESPAGAKILCNWDAGGLSVFNGALYLGARNEIPYQFNTPSSKGGVLYRTTNGTTWTAVTVDGFGSATNTKIEGTVTYNGVLYALTFNASVWETPSTGLQILASTDGVNFVRVNSGLGGKYNTNSLWTSAQAVFGDRLFIGTSNKQAGHGGELYMNVDNQVFLPSALR